MTLEFSSEGKSLSILLPELNANFDLVQKMSGRVGSVNSNRQIARVFRNACLDHLLLSPFLKAIVITRTTATIRKEAETYGGVR